MGNGCFCLLVFKLEEEGRFMFGVQKKTGGWRGMHSTLSCWPERPDLQKGGRAEMREAL
jgi:hypothetical protein